MMCDDSDSGSNDSTIQRYKGDEQANDVRDMHV